MVLRLIHLLELKRIARREKRRRTMKLLPNRCLKEFDSVMCDAVQKRKCEGNSLLIGRDWYVTTTM
jgi:hypothetical protein